MATAQILLWIHALSGILWLGTSACLVLAGLALAGNPGEQQQFMLKVAPKINGANAVAAALLLSSGLGNLVVVGTARDFAFSHTFLTVLSVKTVIFGAMALGLFVSWRIGTRLGQAQRIDGGLAAKPGEMSRLLKLHGLMAAMGAVAVVLGLWLAGS